MLESGQIVNDTYRIIEQIGSGGGSLIYKAYHIRMHKHVAVKLIKDDIIDVINQRQEVDILKNLKNDYLPQVIDFIENGSDIYTVMEFVEGENLKKLVAKGRRFDECQVRKYALQLLKAVEYLHSQDPPIIHSDIKPSNIMLTPSDNVCLIDFNISTITSGGIAKAFGASSGFAAPEQFRRTIIAPVMADVFHEETRFIDEETELLGDGTVTEIDYDKREERTINRNVAYIDMRTDIYGIGATLHYILTGRVPFEGETDFRGIECTDHIKHVITKAMSADPNKRYMTAHEMYEALFSVEKKNSKSFIFIAAAIAILLTTAAGIAMQSRRTDSDVTEMRTESFSETVTAESVETTQSETTFETNEVHTEETDKFMVVSLYESGEVRSRRTAEYADGKYDVTYYLKNGLVDYIEQYDENNDLIIVRIIDSLTGALISEAIPEKVEGGYELIIERESDKYKYLKFVIMDSEYSMRKQQYLDASKKVIMTFEYQYAFSENGDWSVIYYLDGQKYKEIIHRKDGTSDIALYSNTDNAEVYLAENEHEVTVAPSEKHTEVSSSLTSVKSEKTAERKEDVHSETVYADKINISENQAVVRKKENLIYFQDGTVKCRVTDVFSDGGYRKTWYWLNGTVRYEEDYDKNDNMVNLRVYSFSEKEITYDAMPIKTGSGYYYIHESDSSSYSYIKVHVDEYREKTYQEYYDENDKLLYTRWFSVETGFDGLLCMKWCDEQGYMKAYKVYDSEGTKQADMTKLMSDRSYKITWYWPNGLEKLTETYDSEGRLTSVLVLDLETRKESFNGAPTTNAEGYEYIKEVKTKESCFTRNKLDKNRNIILQEYLDKDKKTVYTRTYHVEMKNSEIMTITWYDENGKKILYREYDNDGTPVYDQRFND